MMNINNILNDINEKVGHGNISALKTIYNAERKKKEDKGFTAEVVGEINLVKMALSPISVKYDLITQDEIIDIISKYGPDEYLKVGEQVGKSGPPKPVWKDGEESGTKEAAESVGKTSMEEITGVEGDFSVEEFFEEADDDADKPIKLADAVEEGGWKHIFKTSKKSKPTYSDDDGFKKEPKLPLIDRMTYKLKLNDPSADPYCHNGINKFDSSEYTSYLLKVKLLGISDESLYEDENDDGEPLFVKGEVYALWLDAERVMPDFVETFKKAGQSKPDGRPFYLKRFKKKSKSTGRYYNVFKFAVD